MNTQLSSHQSLPSNGESSDLVLSSVWSDMRALQLLQENQQDVQQLQKQVKQLQSRLILVTFAGSLAVVTVGCLLAWQILQPQGLERVLSNWAQPAPSVPASQP